MTLRMFIDSDNVELKKKYEVAVGAHNEQILNNPHINAGFDLYAPDTVSCFSAETSNKIDFKVKCAARMEYSADTCYNTGFYMYPRSSLSKTPLRLANSVGIIDAGYRGPLIGMFDCLMEEYQVSQYDRLAQICAPGLVPIHVKIVDTVEELGFTTRGEGGFGSTGK